MRGSKLQLHAWQRARSMELEMTRMGVQRLRLVAPDLVPRALQAVYHGLEKTARSC